MGSSRNRLLLLLHSSLLLFLLASPSSFSIISYSPFTSPFLSVEALTVYVAGEGNFFVSDHASGLTSYAAKYQTDTQLWTSLDQVDDGLEGGGAFVVRSSGDDQAYFGGRFQTAGNEPRPSFAKFDGKRSIWNEVSGGTGNQKMGNTVNAIFVNPCNSSFVFLGGGFRQVSNEASFNGGEIELRDPIEANHVALWNADTKEFRPLGDGLTGVVFDLFVQNDNLYATGTFKASQEDFGIPPIVPLNGIASFDLTSPTPSWQPLNGGFRPQKIETSIFSTSFGKAISGIKNPNPDIIDENFIYVLGNFDKVGSGVGVSVNGIARYNTISGTWAALGSPNNDGPTKITVLETVSVLGGEREGGFARVYVGGAFTCRISDTSEVVPNICVWKEETNKWYPVGESFNGTDGFVTEIAAAYDPQVNSDVLYAVGEWNIIDKRPIKKMAYWSQETNRWSRIGNGGSSYRISSVALSLPCNPIPLTVSPSSSPTVSPLPSSIPVFCEGESCDDRDLCTVDFCTEGGCIHTPKTCNDDNICTNDFCSSSTGECVFVPIPGCGASLKTCSQLQDCVECVSADASTESEGCTWLQCAPEANSVSKTLSNFTTFPLSNISLSREFAIFTTDNVTLLLEDPLTGEKTRIPKFTLGNLRAFFASNDDLRMTSAFGATRVTTGQCVPKLLKEKVLENNTPFGLTCEFVENGEQENCGVIFVEADQLSAKAKTIGASVGVTAATAGGGCGGFAVVLLFYRRKKSKDIREAKVAGASKGPAAQNFAAESPAFLEGAGVNTLYSEEV